MRLLVRVSLRQSGMMLSWRVVQLDRHVLGADGHAAQAWEAAVKRRLAGRSSHPDSTGRSSVAFETIAHKCAGHGRTIAWQDDRFMLPRRSSHDGWTIAPHAAEPIAPASALATVGVGVGVRMGLALASGFGLKQAAVQ